MNQLSISGFEKAIEAVHGAEARLIAREHVKETVRNGTVWDGEVLVFELLEHRGASYCYAWESDARVTIVLGGAPVDSALAAVRASILAEGG